MATKTSNYNLIKPSPEDFYNIEDQNKNMDVIDEKLHEVEGKVNNVDEELKRHIEDYERLSDTISNGAIQTTSLNLGMNRIHIPEVSVSPTIEFEGFSYVNLLGKDGNCEDLNYWSQWSYGTSISLDTTNKVFGNSSIKIVSDTNNTEHFAQGRILNLTSGKYYMISGYIKAIKQYGLLRLILTDESNEYKSEVWTNQVNNTNGFDRVFAIFQMPAEATQAYCRLQLGNGNGWLEFSGEASAYFDGIMLQELTEIDRFLSIDQLFTKYPYVDSYGCLINPCFENRRYNLIRNGNCEEGVAYWVVSSNTTLAINQGKFLVTTSANGGYGPYQNIKVKSHTNYYLYSKVTGGSVLGAVKVRTLDGYDLVTNLGSFNSGNNTELCVLMRNGTAGTCYYDSIMLVEGTEPPTEYRSCDIQRFVVEGQFASGDKVKIENGKVSGLLNWKHTPPLYGKDFDWKYYTQYTGYKTVVLDTPKYFKGIKWIGTETGHIVEKYDGKTFQRLNVIQEASDGFALNDTYFYINIPNSNSGFTDNINPNADEVKVFMNGWKAVANNGTRYTLWVSKVDNNPPEKFSTTLASDTIVGQYTISVTDATKLKVGRKIVISGASLFVSTISSIDGNIVTLGNAMTMQIPSGTAVASSDDGTTDLSMLNFCKNNVAPGYVGYRLHYKLINPEPISDVNIRVEGRMWDLVKGDNYVNVDSGIVLNELAYPVLYEYADSNRYFIGYNHNNAMPKLMPSSFKYPATLEFIEIKKNGIIDKKWTISGWSAVDNFGYAYIEETDFDTTATYTADYKILRTLYAQTFGSLSLSYPQSIISTLEGHSKALEQKLNKDSALDKLIDLSVYEEFYNITSFERGINVWGEFQVFANVKIPIARKRCTPTCSVKLKSVYAGNSIHGYSLIPLSDIYVTVNVYDSFIDTYVVYRGYNSEIRDNLRNYGMLIYFDKITIDCRGRI